MWKFFTVWNVFRTFATENNYHNSELRYLRLLHRNFKGEIQVGEIVCNRRIATNLVEIFRQLYEVRYPIERMVLIDEYDADDNRSMTANNTSCFNFRFMTGSTTRVSLHGKGLAIDINPLYNPYVSSRGNVSPAKGKPYAIRTKGRHKALDNIIIRRGDLCHRLFTNHGFSWGGAWSKIKDYQHFEKR
ncbi:MAG: M15 family metallopeptidase [Prevotella sp.]|nr:M15 family metallopeptidase [Candidatus Prevotella equi]